MCMCVKVDSNVCTYVAMFCACMYTQETEGRQTRLLAVAKAVGSHSVALHFVLCCVVPDDATCKCTRVHIAVQGHAWVV